MVGGRRGARPNGGRARRHSCRAGGRPGGAGRAAPPPGLRGRPGPPPPTPWPGARSRPRGAGGGGSRGSFRRPRRSGARHAGRRSPGAVGKEEAEGRSGRGAFEDLQVAAVVEQDLPARWRARVPCPRRSCGWWRRARRGGQRISAAMPGPSSATSRADPPRPDSPSRRVTVPRPPSDARRASALLSQRLTSTWRSMSRSQRRRQRASPGGSKRRSGPARRRRRCDELLDHVRRGRARARRGCGRRAKEVNCWVKRPRRSSSSPTLAATCRGLLGCRPPLRAAAGGGPAPGARRSAACASRGRGGGRSPARRKGFQLGQALAVARHGARGLFDHAGDPPQGVAAAVARCPGLPGRPRGPRGRPGGAPGGIQAALAQQVERRRSPRARRRRRRAAIISQRLTISVAVVLEDAEVVQEALVPRSGRGTLPGRAGSSRASAFWSRASAPGRRRSRAGRPGGTRRPEICRSKSQSTAAGGEQHPGEGRGAERKFISSFPEESAAATSTRAGRACRSRRPSTD